MTYQPSDGTWQITHIAPGIRDLRESLGEVGYQENRKSLQHFLCEYFSNGTCGHKLGKTISPIGATPAGGKILKVRWATPGCGKSGGLRLCVVPYCDEKRVFIAAAFMRKDEPSDAEFTNAVKTLP